MKFEKISNDIYKLNIPFEDGFTCIFALNHGKIIMDSGACDSDAENYIIPAIEEMGFTPEYFICSHMHSDHCGGFDVLAKKFHSECFAAFSHDFTPHCKNLHYLSDGELLPDGYKILSLKGHTLDSIGILDTKTNILVAADAFQLFGIGRYGTNIDTVSGYIETLNKTKNLKLSALISSHDYVPCGCNAFGNDNVEKYISVCFDALTLIENTILENTEKNPQQLADTFNETHKDLPILSGWTFQNVINYLHEIGKL